MKKISIILIQVLCIIVLINCNKDENICNGEFVRDNILLSDTTSEYVANYVNANKVIFNNISNNDEIEFIVKTFKDTLLSYTGSMICDEDTSLRRAVKGETQLIQVILSNSEIEQDVIIRLLELPGNPVSNEEMTLFYGQANDTHIDITQVQGLLVHLPQREPTFSKLSDSLLIGNKLFFEVLEPDINNPGFSKPFNPPIEIKYTKVEGIIYMNDKINDRQLVYNRIE